MNLVLWASSGSERLNNTTQILKNKKITMNVVNLFRLNLQRHSKMRTLNENFKCIPLKHELTAVYDAD